MVADRHREVIDADRSRLEADWGPFPVVEESERVTPREFERVAARADDRGIFRYAGAWPRRDDEVLMVEHASAGGWAQPGGALEPGERYEEAARREVREETRVEVRLRGVQVVLVTTTRCGGRPPLTSVVVSFDAVYESGDPSSGDDHEVVDVGWFSRLPDALAYDSIAEHPPV